MVLVSTLTSCTISGETKPLPNMRPIEEKKQMFVAGEYLFATEEGVSIEELRSIFSEYGIISLEPLIIRDRSYKLVLKNDPGLPTLEKKTTSFGKFKYIEKNQIMQKYKMNP
ncbi:MAG: hypothetical protein ACO1NV_09520 [Leptospira bouyouniensis]|uniref:hypothetical protein n=1 Tax=Leptospira bouyouniensis TaxID=2484911 RepID=UPI001FD4F620|nr:hypothetical protein [Leptospira bouyouniensis]